MSAIKGGYNFKQIGHHTYLVFTWPKREEHTVNMLDNCCDCLGYQMRGSCRHVPWVREILEREAARKAKREAKRIPLKRRESNA